MSTACPDHPKCHVCGADLAYHTVPSGSGMLETSACPKGCKQTISQGSGTILHLIGFHSDSGEPLCGHNKP